MPYGANVSSTISSRPVLATERRIVSTSSGATVRGSISSIEIPSCASGSQILLRVMHHQRQRDDRDVVPLAHDRGLAKLDLDNRLREPDL